MNIKKIIVLLLFTIAIITIITPVNAKLDASVELGSTKTVNGKTELYITVDSDIGMKTKNFLSNNYISKRKAELNNVNKVVVSVKGYKPVTIKKPAKGWQINKKYYSNCFDMKFSIKGKSENIYNKNYSVKFYDKKNKIIRTKNGKVLSEWEFSESNIDKNPKKYFDKLKSKNKKKDGFNTVPFNQYSIDRHLNKIFNTSSSIDYFYNKDSTFKKEEVIETTYISTIGYYTKKMEKFQYYTNGMYKLTIETQRVSSKEVFKSVDLYKIENKTINSSMKNPYFTVSNDCNWTNPLIMDVANHIKTSVSRSNYLNNDIYRMELANAVIRYVQANIKYDYTFSLDQSAVTTLKRGSGTCVGNTYFAGALLRAVGIPTYFETSWNQQAGHTWPVSCVFYENRYQWVPAEPTTDFTDNIYYESYYLNLQEYKYPFQKNAVNWWTSQGGGHIFVKGYSSYWA